MQPFQSHTGVYLPKGQSNEALPLEGGRERLLRY